MPYFHISHGLRGAYVDDSGYVIYAKTRAALKEAIAYEAESYRDAGYIGASKRAVAWLAATQWRDRKNFLPYCLPLAPKHDRSNHAFGIFVSPATREDYAEYVRLSSL